MCMVIMLGTQEVNIQIIIILHNINTIQESNFTKAYNINYDINTASYLVALP